MTNSAALLGRLLLGAIFIYFGVLKAIVPGETITRLGQMGLPVPFLAYAVTSVIEVGVGALFVLGLFGRAAALVLAAWCIATALVAHSNFADKAMQVHFLKNVAMCGGLLYAALFGPGAYSLDAILRTRRARDVV